MISLLIPTFSRSALLARTLATVAAQDLDPAEFEVVIIDNASSDDTRAVSERFIADHPHLRVRYVFEARMGLVCSRNRGAREARGDLLAYTDEDVRLDPGFLRAVRDAFADPAVHVVTGRSLPDYESPPPAWMEDLWTPHPKGRYNGIFSLLDFGEGASDIDPTLCFGVNLATRRATLLALGGTHPDSTPKKYEFYQGDGEIGYTLAVAAAGHRCRYQPAAQLHHWVSADRMRPDYVRARMHYQGMTESYQFVRRHGGALDLDFLRAYESETAFDQAPPESRNPFRKAGTALRLLASPRRLRDVLRFKMRPRPTADGLTAMMRQARREGYAAHQRAARASPRLIEWILQADYLDCGFPELENPNAEQAPRS